MKVMIVAPYFYPKIGGLETYALNVTKGLRANGHEVLIVTTGESHNVEEGELNGMKIFRLPITLKFSNTPINIRWYSQLKRIIRTEKPDVINAHSPVPGLADMAFMARGRTPFVITYHAGSMKKGASFLDFILAAYESIVLKHIFMKSNEIISVYPQFVSRLTRNRRKAHHIPPCVDDQFKWNKLIPKNSEKILYVGKIDTTAAWKGINILLQAMRQVIESHPNAILEMVGEGNAIKEFEKLSEELGIQNNVIFKGPLLGNKLVNSFRSSSMLVLPSTTDSESFGIVLIEAGACGIPVIGSNVGGVPNVIKHGENGLLVPPGDINALAKAIIKLKVDVVLASKLSATGRKNAHDIYSHTSFANKTSKLLESITKINILSIAYDASKEKSDASSVHAFSLARGFVHEGHTVQMVVSGHGPSVQDGRLLVHSTNNKQVQGSLLSKTFTIIYNNYQIYRTASRVIKQTDVIYERHNIGVVAGILLRIRYRKPLYYEVNGIPSEEASQIHSAKSPYIAKALFKLAKIELHAASGIITQTEELKIILKDTYGIKQISTVANGTELLPPNIHSPAKPIKCVYLGVLDTYHDISDLLEVVSKLEGVVELTVIGDGEALPKHMEIYTKSRNIHFLGRIPHNNVARELQKSDVGIARYNLSSPLFLKYGFFFCPLKLLEYSAASLPTILIGQANTFVKLFEKCGACTVIKDATDLPVILKDLEKKPEKLNEMSKNAFNLSQKFSWNSIASETTRCFHEF